MTISRLLSNAVAVFAIIGAGACGRGSSADAVEPAGGSVTLWTDSTELFMEHPALIAGQVEKFAVHLTDLTDFAPLKSGRITLRFQPRSGGAPVVVTQDAPKYPGIYGPSPTFPSAGIYDMTLIVASPQARDSITVPGLRVYASGAEVPRDSSAAEPGIKFLKEQQWKTAGFRTVFASFGSVSASIESSAQVGPAAGRLAELSAPVAGLIDAGSVGRAPAPGQRVTQGQVLAVLTPALGESGSAYAEARARLAEAEDEYNRARRLFAAEAVPERRVHESQVRLQAARETLAGLGGDGGQVSVRAPIAGVVTRRSVPPGSRADAGMSLFTIIDPSVVWLTVNVPAAAAALVTMSSTASFRVEGSTRTYAVRRIVSIGSVIDSVTRTMPVIYEVENGDGSIKVGAIARATVRIGGRVEGLVVPTPAVLDNDGRAVVYVQTEGETFERREVAVAAKDGEATVLQGGLRRGERVVIGAAYQVRLASLSTAVPAHGHVH